MEIDGQLTDRQRREIAYHTQRADLLKRFPVKYDVLTRKKQKWWNHYGWMYQLIVNSKPSGKRALVPGFDAMNLIGQRVVGRFIIRGTVQISKCGIERP